MERKRDKEKVKVRYLNVYVAGCFLTCNIFKVLKSK